MRVALIINPVAGRNRGIAAALNAEAEFRKAGWDVTVVLTERPGDAVRLARSSADQGYDAVLACGGDGTLSQVLAGLLDTGIPAGIIPAGTGNDFARTIGLSRKPAAAAAQLIRGRVADVDLMQVNDGALWSINITGAGFDARVTVRMNRGPRRINGLPAYLAAVMREFIEYRPTQMRLRVDRERWEGAALLVAVANARSYGAGMIVAPMAQIDDGLLDVVLIEHVGRIDFLRTFPRVFRGTHVSHPAVRIWKGKEVSIETPAGPCPVLVDGDVQCETPIQVRVSEGRAKLLLPQRA